MISVIGGTVPIENVTVHNSAVLDIGYKYTFNIVLLLFSSERTGENERWRVKVRVIKVHGKYTKQKRFIETYRVRQKLNTPVLLIIL